MKNKEMIRELKCEISELKELINKLSGEIMWLQAKVDMQHINYYPVVVPAEPVQTDLVRWVANGSTTGGNATHNGRVGLNNERIPCNDIG